MYTCHHRGRWSIWRPRLSTKMEQYVHSCLNETAITADTTAKIPMAESCNRPVPTRKHYLSNHSRLFLLISRSSHSIINHFKDHHPSPEKHVCYIWHTWNGLKSQWCSWSVCTSRIPTIHRIVRVFANYHQPTHFPQSNGQAERGVKSSIAPRVVILMLV